MKSVFGFIIGAVLLFSSITAASAADTVTYDLPELNMKIDIPAGWITLTRDMDENDPDLKELGMDKKTATEKFLSSDVYLCTIPPGYSEIITVFMYEDNSSKDNFDYNLLSDSQLEPQALKEIKFIGQEYCTFTTNSVYSRSPAKYVLLDYYYAFDGFPGYGSIYFTIINGQAIGILLYSFTGGELTAEQRGVVKQVVDGISFTKLLTKPHDSSVITAAGTSGVTVAILAIIFGIIRGRKRKHQEVIFPSQEASAPGGDIR